MPETFTNGQIIEKLQNLGEPRKWLGSTVEYAIPTLTPDNNSTIGQGFVNMTAVQRGFAREAFELWDDLIKIDLDEINARQADITMALSSNHGSRATTSSEVVSIPFLSTDLIADRDIWLGTQREGFRPTDTLDYGILGYRSMVHEVGHAVGLSHPGDYNGSAVYGTDAEYAQDTRQYTIMSYFDAGSDGSGANHAVKVGTDDVMQWASTPLLHDILAIQALYGADMTTRTGNTVYGFNSNAGRGAFDFTLNENPIVAIWDAGGNDTLNVSGFDGDQRIDLRSGKFSDIGALTMNVAIAYGATIENAVGGSGDDTVIGNGAGNVLTGNAGDDTVSGGGGADRLHGNDGSDVLKGDAGDDSLRGGDGSDTLAGGAGADRLYGGNEVDTLTGGDGSDTLNGGLGSDTMAGGLGNDIYYIDTATTLQYPTLARSTLSGGAGAATTLQSPSLARSLLPGGTQLPVVVGDRIVEGLDQGNDSVRASINFTLASNLENLELIGSSHLSGSGNGFRNTLTGNGGNNTLKGFAGNDSLLGMSGNDTLVGGAGRDAMEGHAGRDTFDFNVASDSRAGAALRDHIIRFSHADGDKIDLRGIDAIAGGIDDAFAFIGTQGFAAYDAAHRGVAGMVRAFGGIVQIDIGGNRTADMEIQVSGVTLTASDFIL